MPEVKNSNPMSWEEWSGELVRLAGDIYGPQGAIVECGEQCWRDSYDDGMTPQEALDEDLNYV